MRANTGGDHSAKSKSAMAGMVVHNFVDGVALGGAPEEAAAELIAFSACFGASEARPEIAVTRRPASRPA